MLETLQARLRILIPENYDASYDGAEPTPMRSAGLKFDADGRVAWDAMWGSFCDLAIAGGPPHKGALLEPGPPAVIDAGRQRYDEVTAEICRGIRIATDLQADPSPMPGWVRVRCLNEGMAGWLLRAIVMENVAVRADGKALDLPSSPEYRLDREIKNVITVIAKTTHYWEGHMPREQRRAVVELIAEMNRESPLIVPGDQWDEELATRMAGAIQAATGLRAADRRYAGWLGVKCSAAAAAIAMMRLLVAGNVLARREETTLFVPVNAATDPGGDITVTSLARVHDLV